MWESGAGEENRSLAHVAHRGVAVSSMPPRCRALFAIYDRRHGGDMADGEQPKVRRDRFIKDVAVYFLILAFAGQYVLPYVDPLIVAATVLALATAHYSWVGMSGSKGLRRVCLPLLMLSSLTVAFSMFFLLSQFESTATAIAPACKKMRDRMIRGEVSGDLADTFTALRCPVAVRTPIQRWFAQ